MSPRRSELRQLERHRDGLGALGRVVALTPPPLASPPVSPVVPLERGRRSPARRSEDLAAVVALAPYRARRRPGTGVARRVRTTGPA